MVFRSLFRLLAEERGDAQSICDFKHEKLDRGADLFARLLGARVQLPEFLSLTAHFRNADILIEDPKRLLELVEKVRRNKILLLGRYPDEGGRRLRAIEAHARAKGLDPIIFGDLLGAQAVVRRDEIKEEVLTLAKLCEMVIAEDSEASGHLLELADLGFASIKTAIFRREGMGSTVLVESLLRKYPAFMRLFTYDLCNLPSVLDAAVLWLRSDAAR